MKLVAALCFIAAAYLLLRKAATISFYGDDTVQERFKMGGLFLSAVLIIGTSLYFLVT